MSFLGMVRSRHDSNGTAPLTIGEFARFKVGLLKLVILLLAVDAAATSLAIILPTQALNQTNANAKIQRASQLSTCQIFNSNAERTKVFADKQLAAQRINLKQALSLPQFNTPKLRRLGTASIRSQIKYYKQWASYTPVECTALYGPDR